MRSKFLYLVLAGFCGIAAAALASQWLKAQASGPPSGVSTEIFVAAVAIDVGEEITAQKVQLEKWPADKIPEGASGILSEMEGQFAKQRFYVGEAIMTVKLMKENWSAVRKGFKAVAMKASDVSIANLIQPGDRVDVMAYFSKSELIPRSTTKTVLRGVRVYALDGDTQKRTAEERPKSLRTIELLIREKDAEAWTYANELGNIRLSLGSNEEYAGEEMPNDAGEEFLNWIEEQQKRLEDSTAVREREIKVEMASTVIKPTAEIPAVIEQPPAPVEEEGFSMIKMVEGRMVEYWVVPGKLPRIRGPVQESVREQVQPSAAIEIKAAENRAPTTTSEFSYLDGRKSPFTIESNSGSSNAGNR